MLAQTRRRPRPGAISRRTIRRSEGRAIANRGGAPMAIRVYSYTIYHSPNAYLGTVLLRRAISGLPGVELVRRPIYVPRDRGLMIAELLGGKENRNAGSYNREDCRR